MTVNRIATAVAFAIVTPAALAAPRGPTPPHSIALTPLASYSTGITGASSVTGAEIVAFDAASRRMFTISTGINALDVVDLSDPAAPVQVARISLAAYGGGVNSVAVKNGVVAVAIEANPAQDPGRVLFFDAARLSASNATPLGQVPVGAMPDMLTFTPSGCSWPTRVSRTRRTRSTPRAPSPSFGCRPPKGASRS
jgi:hypothetical protein